MASEVGLDSVSVAAAEMGKVERQWFKIIDIERVHDIPMVHPEGTVILWDVDDTLIDFPHMLGSKAWRAYIKAATANDKATNWHDRFSLYLAQNYRPTVVEPMTGQVVSEMQRQYDVFGYTTRERNKWYSTETKGVDQMTIKQLESVDIRFRGKADDNFTSCGQYHEGVFFIDLDLKGEFFYQQMTGKKDYPRKVVFIDDKKAQVESFESALRRLREEGIHIEFEGYYYTATDPKARDFDPAVANIQLYYFLKENEILTDNQARLIARNEKRQDVAGYYLDLACKRFEEKTH